MSERHMKQIRSLLEASQVGRKQYHLFIFSMRKHLPGTAQQLEGSQVYLKAFSSSLREESHKRVASCLLE